MPVVGGVVCYLEAVIAMAIMSWRRASGVWLRVLVSWTRLSVTDDRHQHVGWYCPIKVGGGARWKILGALAMGRTLVCSDVSVQDAMHVLMPDSSEAFVDQVLPVVADAVLRVNLAAQGHDVACQDYSWTVIGSSLLFARGEVDSVAVWVSRSQVCRGRA